MREITKNRQGFTLIELVIVLIIVGVMGTVVYRFMQRGNTAKTREVATRFLSAVQAAQAEAQSTGRAAVVYIDTVPSVSAPKMASGVVAATDTVSANYRPILSPAAYSFEDGVNFSPGAASIGPAATAVTTKGVNPLICMERCNITSPSGSTSYYFSSADDPSVVYSVVVYISGQSRLFRYRAATNDWE